jgi:hypothetical protein
MERPSASGGIFMMYPVACVVCVVVVAGVCVVVVVVVVVDELDRTVVVVVVVVVFAEVNVLVEAEDDDDGDAGEVVDDGVDMVMEKLMPSLDLFPPKSHLEKSFFSLSRGRFMTWCRESSGL